MKFIYNFEKNLREDEMELFTDALIEALEKEAESNELYDFEIAAFPTYKLFSVKADDSEDSERFLSLRKNINKTNRDYTLMGKVGSYNEEIFQKNVCSLSFSSLVKAGELFCYNVKRKAIFFIEHGRKNYVSDMNRTFSTGFPEVRISFNGLKSITIEATRNKFKIMIERSNEEEEIIMNINA